MDDPRPGRPATVTAGQVEDVVVATLESTPTNATHWSREKTAKRSGLSPSTIGRIWKAFELKPHRADGFQPAFPMMPGMPKKRTHDYLRHGTTSLFAAFNTADGSVISSLHRRHRSIEFKKFLIKIDNEVPDGLEVHLVCDNYGTHKSPAIVAWLEKHPRFHMHYTPTYSSWTNQVERFFGYITTDLLQRSDHRSVQALEADIRAWIVAWNEDPKPFIWTKTADQILEKLGRLLKRINGEEH